MRINKNLLSQKFEKYCRKICGYNITFNLKIINDIIKSVQSVGL